MLVSQERLSSPLLGFNVIQEIIMGNSDQTDNISLVDLLSEALKIQKCNAENLMSAVNTMPLHKEPESSVAKVGGKGACCPQQPNLRGEMLHQSFPWRRRDVG